MAVITRVTAAQGGGRVARARRAASLRRLRVICGRSRPLSRRGTLVSLTRRAAVVPTGGTPSVSNETQKNSNIQTINRGKARPAGQLVEKRSKNNWMGARDHRAAEALSVALTPSK